MVERLPPATHAADVVRVPPALEFRAALRAAAPAGRRKAGSPAHRSWVARNCATMRRASSAQPAPNSRRVAGLVSTEISVLRSASGRRLKRRRFVGGLVPGQHVPAAAGDVGRLIEVFDRAPDRIRHRFADEGTAIAVRASAPADARARPCSSLSARASASTVVTDGLTLRPCSSRMYQSTPMPASSATSSRRSPGVRRRRPAGKADRLRALSFSRRERRKSPNSLCLPRSRHRCLAPRVGGIASPRIIPGLTIGKPAG